MKTLKLFAGALLALASTTIFTACDDSEDPKLDAPVITVADAVGAVGFKSTYPVAVTALANVASIEASADQGTVEVTEISGLGETAATAMVAFTPASEGSASITVTVMDEDDQSTSESFTVTVSAEPTALEITDANVVPANDEVESAIEIEVAGGIEPYTYLWSNESTDASLSAVAAGEYSVTVTDAIGQTATGTYTVKDLTGQVVMVDGDGNVYETTLYDGYYWINTDVMSLSAGDGTEFTDVQVVNIEGEGPNNSDNLYSVADYAEVVFNATVKFNDDEGNEVVATSTQYTWQAADKICPEGWTMPVKENVEAASAINAGNEFTFAPAGAGWSGYDNPDISKVGTFLPWNDLSFFPGRKEKQAKIDDNGNDYWNNPGQAMNIWAGYLGSDATEKVSENGNFINDTGNGNGNVMTFYRSGDYQYGGNHNSGTAACRCVKGSN